MSATTSITSSDLSPEIQTRLADFRRQIDEIDKQLISLLKRRIQIVSQVGHMKRTETNLRCLIRSGREAEMVKYLYGEFKESDFLPEAAAAMWRLIIAASTHHETPLQLAIFGDTSAVAADYFGTFIPQTAYDNAEQALNQAARLPSTIAIIPADSLADATFPAEIKIFALLPFIPSSASRPLAYAAAQLIPEKTSDDTSLFRLTDDKGKHSLLKKAGYFTDENPEIRQLQLDNPEAIRHIHWLGTYANPIG